MSMFPLSAQARIGQGAASRKSHRRSAAPCVDIFHHIYCIQGFGRNFACLYRTLGRKTDYTYCRWRGLQSRLFIVTKLPFVAQTFQFVPVDEYHHGYTPRLRGQLVAQTFQFVPVEAQTKRLTAYGVYRLLCIPKQLEKDRFHAMEAVLGLLKDN